LRRKTLQTLGVKVRKVVWAAKKGDRISHSGWEGISRRAGVLLRLEENEMFTRIGEE